MNFTELTKPFEILELRGGDTPIAHLTTDSREVGEDTCFIAVRGADDDGHRYVSSAIRAGAAAFIVEDANDLPEGVAVAMVANTRSMVGPLAAHFFGHPSRRLKLVGITGTNGKTSITYLSEAMFAGAGIRTGVIGTINYRFGDEVFPAATTTPGPIELNNILVKMIEAGVEVVLMEVSSHALDQYRVDGVDFDAACFTNLSRDHLDYHRTMEIYGRAKARLFAPLLQESAKPGRTAIVNIDDPASGRIVRDFSGRLISCSISGSSKADIRAENISVDLAGTQVELMVFNKKYSFAMPLIGAYNLSNAMIALAVGIALDLDPAEAMEGISSCKNIPGRLELVQDPRGVAHVFVDYGHTPSGLENTLSVLAELKGKRLIVVFGCGGDRDRGKRPLMGKAAGSIADLVVVTSDNPRNENPESILKDIEPGVLESGKRLFDDTADGGAIDSGYFMIVDRAKAIEKAISAAGPGDVVLIAGKGHENYVIHGAKKSHFDDREEAARVFGELSAAGGRM